MGISSEEIEREKQTLPFGWGRFRKAYDQLAEVSEAVELLLAAGVALNPEYVRAAALSRARWRVRFPS